MALTRIYHLGSAHSTEEDMAAVYRWQVALTGYTEPQAGDAGTYGLGQYPEEYGSTD